MKKKNIVSALWRTCAQENNYVLNSCEDVDEEQGWTGTYPTVEVYVAMSLGYRLNKIHEVWHWRESSKTLFKSYVDMFFPIKEESSGWPRSDMTEREKDEYIDAFERENGVTLCKECIEDNPPRRKIAKFILNSLWGGFVKNPFKKKVKDMANQEDLFTWINKDCFV